MCYIPRMRHILFMAFLAASVTGCAQYGPEELDRLVKEDPNFRQMIVLRDQSRSQIRAIKNDLLVKKKAVDAQVERLRGEYDSTAKTQNQRIEKLRLGIAANRNQLRREVETAEAQLKAKEEEWKGLRETLEDVKKMQRDKEISLSASEKTKWDERALMLSEKMRPLEEEILELKIRTKLNKRKISFLN